MSTLEPEFAEAEFSVDEIITAILTLGQYLGDTVIDAIIDNLALNGLLADKNDRFSIGEIYNALEKIFGEGASIFIYPITEALLHGNTVTA